MKKIALLAIPILLLLLSACKSDSQKATDVAYAYSFAMANYNIDEAEQYADLETSETTITRARNFLRFTPQDYIKSDTPATIQTVGTTINSDTSITVSFIKNTPIKKDMPFSVEVRKRNGKWRVHSPVKEVEQSQAPQPKPLPIDTISFDSASSR